MHRVADARPGSSHVYEFAWPSNLPDLGACHALELGFVFDSGDGPDARRLAGEGAPQELADAMHGAWVRFAETGDPGWQAWDAAHPVRVFGDGAPHTPTARSTPSTTCGRPTSPCPEERGPGVWSDGDVSCGALESRMWTAVGSWATSTQLPPSSPL